MRELTTAEQERVAGFLGGMEVVDSRFDEGFPDTYEAHLFLHLAYLPPSAGAAVFGAAAAAGFSHLLFIGKEHGTDVVVGVDEQKELDEYIIGGLEFYFAAPDFSWLVWAYHEPCLHIGGSEAFLAEFKSAYSNWGKEQSPWYEEGGIPVCGRCGTWWAPDMGDWRLAKSPRWVCTACAEFG